MIKYTPASQLTLEGFTHPFDNELDPQNRWVKLAELIPWDELAGIYAKKLRSDSGRETVDIRMVIGAMIVKHKMGLSDRDTVMQIAENIYIQYFCGLKIFQTGRPFDPTLLVDIRKRMGAEVFDAFNRRIIDTAEKFKPIKKKIMGKDKDTNPQGGISLSSDSQKHQPENRVGSTPIKNKGTLKVDATIADQMIKYPTDLSLLNDSREQAERIIDQIWQQSGQKNKPRDYRRLARKAYLNLAKKKRKTKREIRKGLRQQLQFLARDIRIIHHLLDGYQGGDFPLSTRDQRLFWVMQLIHDQQRWMYQSRIKSHPNRIVSLFQPWVRPMVRGKDKTNVEFGSKLNVSEIDGFSRVNRISWEAFNESQDLSKQVEDFLAAFGCYPKLLLADRIYLTRENRAYLKERNIDIVGKPLGRPPKEQLSPYKKQKLKKERNRRNHIEGKFGQAKNAYGLSNIRARRQDTSESWIAAIFFVMNLTRLMKIAGEGIFWLLSFLEKHFGRPQDDFKAMQQSPSCLHLQILFSRIRQ
jgi:transposase, IS5 family